MDMVTRAQAWKKLNELLDNQNLVRHCLAVEAAMADYAERFGVSEEAKEQWKVAGLIHDADWEKYPDEHPAVIVKWLEEEGADPKVINAVASHGFEFGAEPESQMAHAIRACDEITGLITAVALVKGRDLSAVKVQSVRKKMKKKDFAAGVNRGDVVRGAEEIGLDLDEHIGNVLVSMQRVSEDLGL